MGYAWDKVKYALLLGNYKQLMRLKFGHVSNATENLCLFVIYKYHTDMIKKRKKKEKIVHLAKSNTRGLALSKVNSRIWSEFELVSDTVSFLVHSDLLKNNLERNFWHSLANSSENFCLFVIYKYYTDMIKK